ncbi:HTH domain-containing protein [Listeria monocytogenes]|nr:HTH domain-containing protein [Listeria monocytogenes]
MNERQNYIIKKLLTLNEYQTISFFEKELNCSNKTIRKDLHFINQLFFSNQLNSKIQKETGKGIILIVSKNEKRRIEELLEQEKFITYPLLNNFFLALKVFLNTESLTIDELSDTTYSQIDSVKKNLPYWHSYLEHFQLALDYNNMKKIHIIGDELLIRQAFVYCFFYLSYERFQSEISKCDLKIYNEIIKIMDSYFGKTLNSNAKKQIIIYIHIVLERSNSKLNKLYPSIIGFKECNLINEKLSFHTKFRRLDFTEINTIFQLYAISSKSIVYIQDVLPIDKHETTDYSIDILLDRLYRIFNFIPNDVFKSVVKEQLHLYIERSKLGIRVYNPSVDKIKENNVFLFAVFQYIFNEVDELKILKLHLNDITRLVSLFSNEIDVFNVVTRDINATLITDLGIDTVYPFIEKMKKYIPKIKVNKVIPHSDVKSSFNYIEIALNSDFLNMDRHTFNISLFPTDYELIDLKKNIYQYYSKYLINRLNIQSLEVEPVVGYNLEKVLKYYLSKYFSNYHSIVKQILNNGIIYDGNKFKSTVFIDGLNYNLSNKKKLNSIYCGTDIDNVEIHMIDFKQMMDNFQQI